METRDELTERIIGCCYKVHTELGPGFLEKIYHNALSIALVEEGLRIKNESEFEVFFRTHKVGKFRCDMVVEEKVIIELKSVTGNMPPLFHLQLISYLKAAKIKTGLLINFGNKSCEVRRLSV